MKMTANDWERLTAAHQAVQRARRGEKERVKEALATQLGFSKVTLDRKFQNMGLGRPQKPRSDKGKSALSYEQLKAVSGLQFTSSNKKGQCMPLKLVVRICIAQGIIPQVSPATVGRQLRRFGLSAEQLAAPSPSIELASGGPGTVSQVDSTTGAYYYLPDGHLRWMPEDEFYKNKVANLVKASTDLLTRYCITDHTTHCFKARYYLGGETAANLLDFMCWAMWQQPTSPMHGVPKILMMDPGSANKGLLMKSFCRRLGISLIHHAPGSARVTGSVEKAHDIVRMNYETRLRFVDPKTVTLEALNADLEDWTATYCSTAEHTRHHLTRYEAWMRISKENLRVAPSYEALRDAAQKDPETRSVSNQRTVPFDGREYRVDMVPGATPKVKVTVVQNVFEAPAIDVLYVDPKNQQETWHRVDPIQRDEWGFDVNAQAIGDGFRVARNSEIDEARNDFTRQAYQRPGGELPTLKEAARARRRHAQAYEGKFDVKADIKDATVTAYLPRRSTPLDGYMPRDAAIRTLSCTELAIEMKKYLATEARPFPWVEAHYPDGAPDDQVRAIAERFAATVKPATVVGEEPPLRAAGGLA